MTNTLKKSVWCSVALGIALALIALPTRASAQDQMIRPAASPGWATCRVRFHSSRRRKRLGGSRSQPSHEHGDQLWTDEDGRAEVQLGSPSSAWRPTPASHS